MDTPKTDNEIPATVDFGDEPTPTMPSPKPETVDAPAEGMEGDSPTQTARVGARVKLHHLRGTHYADAASAPIWGGGFGHIGGTVAEINVLSEYNSRDWVRVHWDNGLHHLAFPASCLALTTRRDVETLQAEAKERRAEAKARQAEADAVRENEPKAKAEPKPEATDWPEEAKRNREAWLTEAARRMLGRRVPSLLFSVGYGKGGTRGGGQYSIVDGKQKDTKQVFIRPTVHETTHAVNTLATALLDLGISGGKFDSSDWPAYPQPETQEGEHKPQATRLLKCVCGKCGCTFRLTARWVPENEGLTCPIPDCGGGANVHR